VGVGALIAFCSGPGQTFVFAVFIDSLIEDTGLTRTAISSLYAVGTFVSAAMVLTVSRLADRYGIRWTLLGAAIGLGLACFSMSLAYGAVLVFFAFAALRALGQGSMTINGTLLVAQWFVRRRGRAMSLMHLGIPVAVAVQPPVARFLIDSIGWREAYIALGVMVWVLIIPPAIFLVRDRPESVGLYPDGDDAAPASERVEPGIPRQLPPVFTSMGFWLLALPLATMGLVGTGLAFHQVGILEEHGLSATVAANIFIPYAIVSAGASLTGGVVVDRLGPKPVFAASMVLVLCAMTIAMFMNSLTMAVIYAVVLGSAGGSAQLAGSVAWAYYYGRQGLGRVQGAAMMIGVTASALGPLPFAWLQTQFDGFRGAIFVMMLLPVLALVALAVGKPPVEQPRGAATTTEAGRR
jgi:MFS family permease